MLITHEREKLLNAIIYFAKNTRDCGVTKLIKLIFLLDFEHFKQTGRSVTEMEYQAWWRGPVPPALWHEIDDPKPDFAEHVAFTVVPAGDYERNEAVPLRDFDPRYFSRRELHLMEQIAEKYRTANSSEMVDVTHAENQVWDKVYQGGKGQNNPIPYELALEDEENKEDIIERAAESQEMRINFK
jgi:uncharacterized phage-associated protein